MRFCKRNADNSNSNSEGNSGNSDQTSVNWVDLGLPSGLLWADRNVGATTPEDYGNYYAWGEIATKSVYDWDTNRYASGDYNQLTKYCDNSYCGYNGFTDNLTTLQPGDDAATVNMGNGARTPTKEEWIELIDNITSTWVIQNGVKGRLFTASNGNSLFLPAAGTMSSAVPEAAATTGLRRSMRATRTALGTSTSVRAARTWATAIATTGSLFALCVRTNS